MKFNWHYLALTGVIFLGAGLRFWHLDAKPLWTDEVITALFSFGRSYTDIPLDKITSIMFLDQVFTLRSGVTCPQIAQTVAIESNHPPLFFCLMYRWLSWAQPTLTNWIWQLRALPALMGVGAIAAIYQLNRVAFSQKAGLMGAALMAVSPFAVYLSQEARHYTLPMLLVTLALLGLIQLQQDLHDQRPLRPLVGLGWVAMNSVGFYVHYFFLLAFIAQVLALATYIALQRQYMLWRQVGAVGMAIAAVGLSYLPWVTTLIDHMGRGSDWLTPFNPTWVDQIAPLYHLPIGWILMVIALPVENYPTWIEVLSGTVMFLFAVWLGWHFARGMRWLWQTSKTHAATLVMVAFTIYVLLEFLGIVYILDKDITKVFRYNFVYYPAIAALIAASLTRLSHRQNAPSNPAPPDQTAPVFNLFKSARCIQASVLVVGLLSSILVVSDFVFQKPYYPQRVAAQMNFEPTTPLAVIGGYKPLAEAAISLSFVLEIRRHSPERVQLPNTVQYGFFPRHQPGGYGQVWQQLAQIQPIPNQPLNLWIVGPGLRRREFPNQLSIAKSSHAASPGTLCDRVPEHYYRLGIPYQLYRCETESA
ncbi:MAG: hypothetical protein F6K19_00185 [Cyanothece sp. SIO1E1]|nr:hypothetical protein [Cyanothece sp. SIO1E1]